MSAEAFNGSAFVAYSSLPALQGNVHAVTFRNESVCVIGRRGGYAVVPPSLGMCFYVCARMGLRHECASASDSHCFFVLVSACRLGHGIYAGCAVHERPEQHVGL